jgi:hypothetical protein
MAMIKLGKDVFVALAAVGWADGKMSEDEAKALVHAAQESGVTGPDLDAVMRVTIEKVDLKSVKVLTLTPRERVYVYAIATWLARIDGVVMPEEREMLAELGNFLKLADGDRTRASAASFAIEQLAEESRPSRFDLVGLAAKLQQVMAPTLPPPSAGDK